MHPPGVQPPLEGGVLQQRLDLGAEAQRAAGVGDVERLDPQPVPRQQQTAAATVVEREAEHALQPLEAGLAQLLVEVHHHLAVAAALKV